MKFYTNWRKSGEKKRIGLSNLCSVENDIRFVLSSTLNLAYTSDDKFIKREARKYKDSEKDNYKRRYAKYVISNNDSSLTPREEDELAKKCLKGTCWCIKPEVFEVNTEPEYIS